MLILLNETRRKKKDYAIFSLHLSLNTFFFFWLSMRIRFFYPPFLLKYTINQSSLYKRLVALCKSRKKKWAAGKGMEERLFTVNRVHLSNFEHVHICK